MHGLQDGGSAVNEELTASLRVSVDSSLEIAGLPRTDRTLFDLVFVCDRRLHTASIATAKAVGFVSYAKSTVLSVRNGQEVSAK